VIRSGRVKKISYKKEKVPPETTCAKEDTWVKKIKL